MQLMLTTLAACAIGTKAAQDWQEGLNPMGEGQAMEPATAVFDCPKVTTVEQIPIWVEQLWEENPETVKLLKRPCFKGEKGEKLRVMLYHLMMDVKHTSMQKTFGNPVPIYREQTDGEKYTRVAIRLLLNGPYRYVWTIWARNDDGSIDTSGFESYCFAHSPYDSNSKGPLGARFSKERLFPAAHLMDTLQKGDYRSKPRLADPHHLTWDDIKQALLYNISEQKSGFDGPISHKLSYLLSDRSGMFPPTPKYAIGDTVKVCYVRKNHSQRQWWRNDEAWVEGEVVSYARDKRDWAILFYNIKVTSDGKLKGKEKGLPLGRLHAIADSNDSDSAGYSS